jgi:hypothetical protein
MIQIVFFLEELSAKVMLEGFLPCLVPEKYPCRFIVFEGKQDLEKQITRRIRGYQVPNARFVVLRDKDSEELNVILKRLKAKCVEALKPESLVRVACYELESWYLGDLAAVEKGLNINGLAKNQLKAPYNQPDELAAPAQKLQSIAAAYQKVGGSRAIGPHLNPAANRSKSFQLFVDGIKTLVSELEKVGHIE